MTIEHQNMESNTDIYRDQIGQIPMLNGIDAEAALARQIEYYKAEVERTWNDLEYASQIDDLDSLKNLLPKLDSNQKGYLKYRNRMAEANLRLAASIAYKYQFRGLSIDDLIQHANLGLFRAIDKFDWRRGYKFSTYATWWSRQQVVRAVMDESQNIRVAVHMQDDIKKYSQIKQILLACYGQATNEDIARELGITIQKANELEYYFRRRTESLDEPFFNEDEQVDRKEFLPSNEPSVEDQAIKGVPNLEIIEKAFKIAKLDPRETKVLMLRNGLTGQKPMTLTEVAHLLGPDLLVRKRTNRKDSKSTDPNRDISRERVRQIEAQARRKILSSPAASSLLKTIHE